MTTADVHLACLDLDPVALARCAAVLSQDETARAERFLRAEDRARFLASHAALRVVLAGILDVPPAEIRFSADRNGRPALAAPVAVGLDVNLSHSGHLALIGVARGAQIGVDVEVRRSLPDALRIAHSHFAPDETAALAALADGEVEEAFFALWTRKEAVAKAMGAGLSLPLAGFSVTVPPAPPRVLRGAGDPAAWTLAGIAVGTGACATAAVAAASTAIRTSHLPAGWPARLPA